MIKRLFIGIIRLYQRFISPYKGFKCPYCPTCSSYAIQALDKHGAIRGSALATWRILRCNPFSHGGFDPVPDNITYSFRRKF